MLSGMKSAKKQQFQLEKQQLMGPEPPLQAPPWSLSWFERRCLLVIPLPPLRFPPISLHFKCLHNERASGRKQEFGKKLNCITMSSSSHFILPPRCWQPIIHPSIHPSIPPSRCPSFSRVQLKGKNKTLRFLCLINETDEFSRLRWISSSQPP